MPTSTTHPHDTGRLSAGLHPTARDIIYSFNEHQLQTEFKHINAINEAHLLMLHQQKLIPFTVIQPLLALTESLKKNQFNALLETPLIRGTYFQYENHLIDQLGHDIAGNIHIARSRNDLLATAFLMKLRHCFIEVTDRLLSLRQSLLNKAQQEKHTAIPIYTHYQTALPSNLGFHLLAIEVNLQHYHRLLQQTYAFINQCPLGAGAGGGTSFEIDPTLSAQLLGFDHPCPNSLAAIANRDQFIMYLGNLNLVAMTLSRLTEDLQLWSTGEFHLIDFPDNLCGCSSMMPQKKNPFILESIKGKLLYVLGSLSSASSMMYKVPYGNSVEIMFESVGDLDKVNQKMTDAMTLLDLMVQHVTVNPHQVQQHLTEQVTYATYVCEKLVAEQQVPFRQAHHLVGKTIRDAMDTKNYFQALGSLRPESPLSTNPLHWCADANAGGGPGIQSTQQQWDRANQTLQQDRQWLDCTTQKLNASHASRQQKIDAILARRPR